MVDYKRTESAVVSNKLCKEGMIPDKVLVFAENMFGLEKKLIAEEAAETDLYTALAKLTGMERSSIKLMMHAANYSGKEDK